MHVSRGSTHSLQRGKQARIPRRSARLRLVLRRPSERPTRLAGEDRFHGKQPRQSIGPIRTLRSVAWNAIVAARLLLPRMHERGVAERRAGGCLVLVDGRHLASFGEGDCVCLDARATLRVAHASSGWRCSRIAQAEAPRASHAVGEARACARARTKSACGACVSDFGGGAEAHAALPVGVDRLRTATAEGPARR